MVAELVAAVDAYLVGRWTLQELEAWLAARTRAIYGSGDRRAMDLANKLEADLIDLGEGVADEATIRKHWEGYLSHLTTLTLFVGVEKPTTTISAASTSYPGKYESPELIEPTVTIPLTFSFA